MEDPENGFHFERIDNGVKRKFIPNVQGKCPECGLPMTYVHDLRCEQCDNQFIQYCRNCDEHYRLEPDSDR